MYNYLGQSFKGSKTISRHKMFGRKKFQKNNWSEKKLCCI